MATKIPAQLVTAIKGRKFGTVAKLFAPGVDFQAWTPTGHWVASDGSTASKIIETWFSPGVGSQVVWSSETAAGKNHVLLEYEISWSLPPDDQPRVLRQAHFLTIKNERIVAARIYCAGPHTEFPEVDLEKLRRAKGLGAPGTKPLSNSPKVVVSTKSA
jgi:hypothetical protein